MSKTQETILKHRKKPNDVSYLLKILTVIWFFSNKILANASVLFLIPVIIFQRSPIENKSSLENFGNNKNDYNLKYFPFLHRLEMLFL